MDQRLASGGVNFSRDRVGGVLRIARVDYHIRPVFSEGDRDGATDAAHTTCHYSGQAV
jgi:hypothetical protein